SLFFIYILSIVFFSVGLCFLLIYCLILFLPALTILILAPEYYSTIKQIGKDFHATLDGQLAMQDIDQFIEQSKALTIEYNEALTWQTNSTLELSVVDYKIDDAYLLK